MHISIWISLIVLSATVATNGVEITGIPDGYELAGFTTYDCHWRCADSGQFLECADDEIGVGTCGSADFAQCTDRSKCPGERLYTALNCCKIRVTARAKK